MKKINANEAPVEMSLIEQQLLDELETLTNGLAWNIENHPEIMTEADSEALDSALALIAKVKERKK